MRSAKLTSLFFGGHIGVSFMDCETCIVFVFFSLSIYTAGRCCLYFKRLHDSLADWKLNIKQRGAAQEFSTEL